MRSVQWIPAAAGCLFATGAALAQSEPAPLPAAGPDETAPASAAEAQEQATGTIPVGDTPSAPPETAAPARPQNRFVEEVVVTANRREENVQDVPQAVTAFSNEKLEASGIQTVQDLPNITPGLTITNQAGFSMVFLRGVGTDAFLPGADASVPFYVDGIPLLATQGSADALGKIARVEVLKGPQGTLFGANSIGGAINIVTPDPTHDFSGEVQAGYGNYRTKKASAYLNLPIIDSVAASLTAYGSKQENFYTNDIGGVFDVYNYGGRLKVLWDITDNLDNTLSASYNRLSNNGGLMFENTLPAPRLGSAISAVPADPGADRHVAYDGFQVGAQLHSTLISDTLSWRGSLMDIKAIGSYQDLVPEDVRATFGAGSLALAEQAGKNRQYTGELQFLSNADTPFHEHLNWVGGLFYMSTVGGLDPFRFIIAPGLVNGVPGVNLPLFDRINAVLGPVTSALIGLDPSEGLVLLNRGVIKMQSYSGYFQGTYSVTDELNLILGGRYQYTRKDLSISQTSYYNSNTGGELPLFSDDLPMLKSKQFSSRAGLQYRFDNDTQAYASWARGYKTPTYNTVNLLGSLLQPIEPVKAQRNDAFELGLKTELFDHTLRLNSALFYTKEKDLLTGTVQVLSGGIVNYDNAKAARIYGAETEGFWTPLPELNPGLVITFSGAYLNSKYTDYKNGRGYDPATGLSYGEGNVLPLLPARDQTGNEIPRTPEYTANLGIGQTLNLSDDLSLELAADGSYNSGFWWSAQNADIEKTFSYHLINARATLMVTSWGADFEIFVRNLTQENYYQTVFVDDFGRNITLNDPRTYGFRVKWAF